MVIFENPDALHRFTEDMNERGWLSPAQVKQIQAHIALLEKVLAAASDLRDVLTDRIISYARQDWGNSNTDLIERRIKVLDDAMKSLEDIDEPS